mgnify:CR=1 FL=1
MYVLNNGHSYIGVNSDNVPTSVSNIKKALHFSDGKKASNYKDNLKTTLKKFNWQIVKVDDDTINNDTEIENTGEYIYVETPLEKSGFDISKFFNEAIETVSQLRDYANNMNFLEQEYNKKILDVRHYKRDINTKLSAIQLQRLEQFEIQLERERYECKSNRVIAEIFLTDLKRLENIKYIEVVRNIKESEYKPEILTYEMLDSIVGKKRK